MKFHANLGALWGDLFQGHRLVSILIHFNQSMANIVLEYE